MTGTASRHAPPPRTAAGTPWGAVSIVLAGAFMAILDSFIVIVAGPAIQAELGTSGGELQWILAGYQLTYAVFLITGGRLGDLRGRKRVFIAGMALFTLASVGCAVAQSAAVLIAARLAEGLGAALMLPQVYAAVTVLVPEKDRHRAFGYLGVVMGFATIGGQLVGGLLIGTDLFGSGWRSVFWINVPIGIATILFAARYLPESRAALARGLDLPGVAVLSVALLLLTFPLIQGEQAGWPWWTWAGLAASCVAFALFGLVERGTARRGGDPLLRLHLFRARSFSVGIPLVVTIYALITSYYLVLSIALQEGLSMSALKAGLVYTPAAATFFVFSLIASRLVPRYGRRVLEIGAIVLAVGYASTVIVLTGGISFTPAAVIPTLMLQSVGGGLLITPSLNAVLARIAPGDAGIASGVLSTAQQVGAALGVAVIGAVFFTAFDSPSPGRSAAAHALAMASIATAAIALVAAVLVYLLPSGRRRTS
ncbi:MFS transporter [Actinomadura mexicana]|uniref:Drug resistance transporter, EmrB/QacA subfamily n=1 Tax=Actinomadura mexicana TaxID=134959 RepID=A0A238XAQ8_9ACTN|nr:MFS transporter [Actinomadura mexicana]SNR54949.1 drug resistance transporter, EmrB/QacA subfamily [Actinomadura mexicana]